MNAPVAELRNDDLPGASRARTLEDADRAHIISTLQETNWVVGGLNGAAARLGLKRTTLNAKMRKLGVSRDTAPQQNAGQMDA